MKKIKRDDKLISEIEEKINESIQVAKDRIELISDDTLEVGKTWDRPIDILLIDANHHYQHVLADITNFVPYVKPNGVIMLDDYHISEVSKAVDETLIREGYELIRKPDPKYNMAEKLIAFRGK